MVTKKVIIGAGGLTTVLAVLLYLSTMPGVTITTSGDINCWGTAANPCVSYFNISSSTYILKVFNTSGQKLDFSPDVKDYKIYRFVSRKWTEIKFPINMTKGVLYQFKLVGYKNNPGDNVKWGVRTGDVYADPWWNTTNISVAMPSQTLYPLENSSTDSNRSTTLWTYGWDVISGGYYTGDQVGNRSTNNATVSAFNLSVNLNSTFFVTIPKKATVLDAKLNLSTNYTMLSINGVSVTMCGYNDTYDKIEVINGGTLTICAYGTPTNCEGAAVPKTGCGYVNISTSYFVLDSTSTISVYAKGYPGGGITTAGSGTGGGGPGTTYIGGGGAGYGNTTVGQQAGDGTGTTSTCYDNAGKSFGTKDGNDIDLGSGGGGANTGTGGAGGGLFYLNASNGYIGIAGYITANGANGGNGVNSPGGGAGSGGGVFLFGYTVDTSNSHINASGGIGGVGNEQPDYGGGGSGAGGRIKINCTTCINTSAVYQELGGGPISYCAFMPGGPGTNTSMAFTGTYHPTRGIPFNPYLNVSAANSSTAWSFLGGFNQTDNRTFNFSSSIQNALFTCSANAIGNCNVTFLVHSDTPSTLEIADINITYTTRIALTEYPRYAWYKFNLTGLAYFDNATLNVYQQLFKNSDWGYGCNATRPCMTEIYYSPNQTWKQPLSWDNKTAYDNYVIEKRNVTTSEGWNIWTVTEHLKSVLANATFMIRIPQLNIERKAMNLTSSQNATYKPYILASVTKYIMNESSCIGNTSCYQNGTFTPKGQTDTQWIFNITNINTAQMVNITAYLNGTLPSCMNHWISQNSTFERTVDYNISNTTEFIVRQNLTIGKNQTFWGFWTLNNCSISYPNVSISFNATVK